MGSTGAARAVFVEMEKAKVPRSGLGQFCLHVGAELARLRPPGLALTFYLPRARRGAFGDGVRYLDHSPLHKLLSASRAPFDVWHCIHQDSPYLPPRRATRLVLTIHDLNFMQKYEGARRRAKLAALQRRVDRAQVVTFISRFTEADARAHLRLDGKPTRVVYNGNSLVACPDAPAPAWAPRGPFLLTLGIVQPKKNFHVLVPFLRGIEGRTLVIAGAADGPYAAEIRALAAREGVADRVLLPGPVGDAERYWLYSRCEAFLFPSRAEGFGLPVIEAMSLGKPVFLSRLTSLPETGGAEAFYFEDFDPEGMRRTFRDGLAALARDPARADRLRAWAARFSWERAAREYCAIYAEV